MALIRIGHSPDSDDAFMFHGLASGAITSPDLEFEHVLRDIQTLNEWARDGILECTAISVHAYAYVSHHYAILMHGASMGDGYGPKVVSRALASFRDLEGTRIAIPGEMTSAFLALSLLLECPLVKGDIAAPGQLTYRVVPFDEIVDAVVDGEFDSGLIIHEGQLTHADDGLAEVVDLGRWWKDDTGLPLPLGVNVIRRDMPRDLQAAVSRAMKDSIAHGLGNRADALQYALQFARGLAPATADQFVGMYVNNWTLDMGDKGRRAIALFLARGAAAGFIPATTPDFVT